MPPPDSPVPPPDSADSPEAGDGGASDSRPSGWDPNSTIALLERIRAGDAAARDTLLRRYLPALRRWAHGRLPGYARHLLDTDDLVQVTLIRALDHLEGFEPTRPGALLAYLRRALLNRIRDEIRKVRRTPARVDLPDEIEDPGRSPLEREIGRETLEIYEEALARLPEEQQEAIVMRIEMGLSYREIAAALGRPTENAARLFIVRALARLGEEIRGAGFEP